MEIFEKDTKKEDKTAIFIDGDYMYQSTKKLDIKIDFSVFLSLLNKTFGESIVYYYSSINPENKYYKSQQSFLSHLSNFGYIVKTSKFRKVKTTGRYISNIDMLLAVDALSISEGYNKIVLVSGDTDFVPLVKSLKENGKEIILLGLPVITSSQLKMESSQFWNIEKFFFQMNALGISKKTKLIAKIQEKPKELYLEKEYYFDNYVKIRNLLKSAKKSITIIDNYVNEEILYLAYILDKSIKFNIISKLQPKNKDFFVMLSKLKKENRNINFYQSKLFHDRFIKIDDEWWHLGHSIKDLGSGDSMIIKISKPSIIENLKQKEKIII